MGGVSPRTGADSTSELRAVKDAERSGRPFLLYRDGSGRQRVFVFTSGMESATVGRRSTSDLALDWDEQVSRLHARIEPAGEDWLLVDDGTSSNGTFVNDERVSGSRRLSDGDRIRFGTTEVAFRAPVPERATSAPSPPPQPAGPSPPPQPAGPVPPRERAPGAVALSTTQRRVLAALCRPFHGGSGFASPATDEQIAEELVLSVGEVQAHLRVLHAKVGVSELPRDTARVRLVERAFADGLISERDF